MVHITIGKAGHVCDAKVSTSSGFPLLDDHAVEAAEKWRFEPALVKGEPVACSLVIPFRFSLS